MARVTVEDCIDKIDNRFELVMIAAQRARTLSSSLFDGSALILPASMKHQAEGDDESQPDQLQPDE